MKKYYLRWVIEDEDGDLHGSVEVEGPEGNIYAYPKLEYGVGLIRLVEVEEGENSETTLEKYVLVDMKQSLEKYGDQLDEEGYRRYIVYIECDTVTSAKINPEKITAVDYDEYHMRYDRHHQEWLDAHTAPGGDE